MKKVISGIIALVAVVLFFAPTAQAAGAITADEQRILDELNQGVSVGGKTFNLRASDIAQAENHLKQNDISASEANQVIAQIQQARALIASSGVDVSNINSIEDLIKALPLDIKNQLKDVITQAANILGLSISFNQNGFTINGSNGTNGADGANGSNGTNGTNGSNGTSTSGSSIVYSSGSAVKQTGATYVASAISFASLLLVAAGAAVVGRKKIA
ncbi:hypothetical protein [Enterococcus hermanniensis]|uniref:Gram-positive cocci surface proteins LPxTG domain-containing protein n=1 Tax=Enterococcus hermanniensis TaxID=249189 RepID=A0A1L8TRZ8_9ENTE|nr:hypothetical protein [Enterococcus hermanniensis]OJG47089.1 hypothetical protein RV04_GL000336 [Enterococcus hermanniensis]